MPSPRARAAKAGTGTIRINNGAGIRIEAANGTNSNFAAGQQVLASSVPLVLSRIDIRGNQTVVTQTSGNFGFIHPDSYGILGLEVSWGDASNSLNMAAIGNGRMYLAADQAAASYTANALGAGASNQYGGSNLVNIYRLGTGAQTLTLAPVTAASTVLVDPAGGFTAKVYVGNMSTNSSGSVTFNQTNTYSAGTVVMPTIGATNATATITTGGANTPLGTGQVDVFGLLTASGAAGSFLNGAGTANSNAIVLHPGSTLTLTNTGVAAINRWADTQDIGLNGATFSLVAGTASTTETVGSITFDRGARINLNANAQQITLNQSATKTLTRGTNGTLVFNNSAAGRLGLAPATNSERFLVNSSIRRTLPARTCCPATTSPAPITDSSLTAAPTVSRPSPTVPCWPPVRTSTPRRSHRLRSSTWRPRTPR
ncbi:MAG: hypothetical protein QM775_13215 [Pirellulales bacterium]